MNKSADLFSPQDALFDADGDLWVVDGGLNDGKGTGAAVYEFSGAQLAALATTPNPTPVFVNSALTGGTTLIFLNLPRLIPLATYGSATPATA